jgi:hypothetical protein
MSMGPEKRAGRTVGMLLYLQLAGLIVPFVLLLPLAAGPKAYLANAAGASVQIRTAVLLLFANCALTIGITIVASRVLRQYSEAMHLWLLAAGVSMFLLQAVDNIHVLSMLSLSQQYSATAGADALSLAVASAVGGTRGWSHTTELLVIDCWIALLYVALFRFVLVPRALAALGLVTVTLHFIGVPLPGFAGYRPIAALAPLMAVSHVALATWLVIKGFPERYTSVRPYSGSSR